MTHLPSAPFLADSSATAGMSPTSIVVVSVAVAVVVLSAAVLFLGWLHRGRDPLVIGVLRFINNCYTGVVHGVRPRVRDPFPAEGPAILVANHRSSVDPFVIQRFTGRVIRFLMAREYYESFGLHWLFRTVGAIPVNRDGNDLAATKMALRALQHGEVIGIFPEGGIRHEDPDSPFSAAAEERAVKHGAALLALRTGAPVITAYVEGTPSLDSVLLAFLRRSRSRVTFGEPLRFESPAGRRPDRDELEEATQRIVGAIEGLRQREAGAPGPAFKP